MELDRPRLDALYEEWNRPEYISPDPLETLAAYPDILDREVAALMAAAMAYGRVNALLPPLKRVLTVLGASPRRYVCRRAEADIAADLHGIVHRFARAPHIAALLAGAGAAIRRYGSLEAAFLPGYKGGLAGDGAPPESEGGLPGDGASSESEGGLAGDGAAPGASRGDVVNGLSALVRAVKDGAEGDPGHLLPDPDRGSACKRLHLFLRWMVRRDAVDPGGWNSVDTARLLMPLDIWTYRIALRAGWTRRKSADMKTVREVSAALSAMNPEDPIRYDFALSRFGIRSGLDPDKLFSGSG